jgi:hypothetical protein
MNQNELIDYIVKLRHEININRSIIDNLQEQIDIHKHFNSVLKNKVKVFEVTSKF